MSTSPGAKPDVDLPFKGAVKGTPSLTSVLDLASGIDPHLALVNEAALLLVGRDVKPVPLDPIDLDPIASLTARPRRLWRTVAREESRLRRDRLERSEADFHRFPQPPRDIRFDRL